MIYTMVASLYLLALCFTNSLYCCLLKPIPILCLIFSILQQSSIIKSAKILLLIALSFSLLGDIVLISPVKTSLLWGIGFFMIAHCNYIILLLNDYSYKSVRLIGLLPIFLLIIIIFGQLIPYLNSEKFPVIGYLCVLTGMVFSAFQVRHNVGIIACGAMTFLISDTVLALNLFMLPEQNWHIITMATYYLAQLLLISGLLKTYTQSPFLPT